MAEVSQEAMDKLEQFIRILGNLLSMPKDIVEQMITKYQREYKEDPSIESFLKYIRSGGTVFHVEMEPENAEVWAHVLKERHIDYYRQQVTREDGSVHEVFVFKDRDRAQVALMRENMKKWLSKEANEFDTHTFRDMMMGKQISIASGLSLPEVYAFRENCVGTDLKFVVLKDKDNTYKIYASDNELMMATLAKANYDLVSDVNGEYERAVYEYRNRRMDLLDRTKENGSFVIADKDNPNNFIFVRNEQYSLHKFEKVIIEENGVKREVIKDVAPDKFYTLDSAEDRALFLKRAERMHNPVMIDTLDFSILHRVDNFGHAFAEPDIEKFETKFSEVKEHAKEKEPVLAPKPHVKPRWTRDQLSGYINLPEPLVSRIAKDVPYVQTNAQMTAIAFPAEKQEEMDRYLFDNLSRKFGDDLVSIAFLLRSSGRSGANIPNFKQVQETPVYLLNADDPSTLVSIASDGIRLFHEGKETRFIPITDAKYQDLLVYYTSLDFNPNPVFMTDEEMHSPEKDQLIWKRANLIMDNPVIEDLVSREETEKARIVNERMYARDQTEEEIASLSDEQKAAIEKTKDTRINVKELKGTVISDMHRSHGDKEHRRDEEPSI